MKAILLNRILLVLAFAGLFVAGTLSLAKLLNFQVPCGVSNQCEVVTSHPSAFLFGGPGDGLPVAYLGFLAYAALAVIAVAQALIGPQRIGFLSISGYVISALGAAFSLYLQYQALFVIRATCVWCLASAIIMVLSVIFYALLAQTEPIPKTDSRSGIAPADLTLLAVLPLVVAGGLTATWMQMKGGGQGQVLSATQKEVQLVPDQPHSYGNPDAPVTVVEFADMCCGMCRSMSPQLKEFVEKSDGRFRMVYRHFPLLGKHEMAVPAAIMSEYAAEKNKFWDFLLAVMSTPEVPHQMEDLLSVARNLGFDTEEIKKRMQDTEDPIFNRMYEDLEAANKLGLQMTPTFIIIAKGMPTRVVNGNDLFPLLEGPTYQNLSSP